VPADRTFTFYNAVHQRFMSAPAESWALSAPVQDAPADAVPFFLYPANAWKHKNHEVLLLAYGIYRAGALASGTIPWPLVLTGHEDQRWREMQALADALGLLEEGAVSFRGYVPSAELSRLWGKAGALVFPSLHEGFGIPLLEAMQHDLPVLSSREGSLPEVGADACLYADARNPEAWAAAMTSLATDAALRQQLVAAGRIRLADFSLDREAAHLLDAIVELSGTAPPYRPQTRGIFPDGWTEGFALLALPGGAHGTSRPGRLTLRFHVLPAARRVRLRTGTTLVLGSFNLPSYRPDYMITFDFHPDGGVLWLEVPDAANINPADGRIHGVRLLAADFRQADGQEYALFSAR
jgi:hypothetical protein